MINPWHDLSVGNNAPRVINSVIEIAMGSKTKYELDKATGFLRLDRVLKTDLRYPFHYGLVPQTFCPDNDPLDIIVLCSEPLLPLSLVEGRVLGAISMLDNNEQDDKIIAVAEHDPYLKQLQSFDDLPQDMLNTFTFFLENYKKFENKEVIIKGFLSQPKAQQLVNDAINLYKKTFIS